MARRSRSTETDTDMELNMTPMLDVVFILLIFFIVTSVFVKQTGVDPFEPQVVNQEQWDPGILIAVNAEDEIWIDKVPYRVNQIRPVIQSLRDSTPGAKAIITGDQEASVGVVMSVQEILTDLGVETRVATDLK